MINISIFTLLLITLTTFASAQTCPTGSLLSFTACTTENDKLERDTCIKIRVNNPSYYDRCLCYASIQRLKCFDICGDDPFALPLKAEATSLRIQRCLGDGVIGDDRQVELFGALLPYLASSNNTNGVLATLPANGNFPRPTVPALPTFAISAPSPTPGNSNTVNSNTNEAHYLKTMGFGWFLIISLSFVSSVFLF